MAPLRRFAAVAVAVLFAGQAAAAPILVPHQAVYDLKLAKGTEADISNADGRIAMSIRAPNCEMWDFQYRFVARFRQDQETTLTDQQTTSSETRSGDLFTFLTKTFVDGSPEKEVKGEARQEASGTRVSMQQPEAKSFVLPLSRFPMQHTVELIRRAEAGDRIVEAKLFDGDEDGEKLLTSTAVIAPAESAAVSAPGDATAPEARAKLAGKRAWRISESYYNADSDDDGMPIFETRYVLYENGVSDDLTLDFGTYALSGSLKSLDLLDAPVCP